MEVAGTGVAPQVDEPKIRAQLKKWQERLLDLTKGNPLLGINRSRVSKLRVTSPDASELFQAVAVNESELKMPMAVRGARQSVPEPDQAECVDNYRIEPGDLAFEALPVELARRLRRIHDNARTSMEERGVTTLHITFGTLTWRDSWLGESVTPLWMVPAHLTSKGPNAALRLTVADEEMQLNPALELYLRERHKISLPEIPEEPEGDGLNRYLELVQHAVREQDWSVAPEVWLSTFSFEALVIYQDLKAMADVATSHPVVAALARASAIGEGSEAISGDLDDLETPNRIPVPILQADGSQLEALTHAAAGAHVVMHGPPGTGKSQTISNLIADALGRNKTVLFVSSKMAALNVVYQRIADKGLARFCLEAHSSKAGKAKIVDELRRTLETEDATDGGRFEEQLVALLRVRADLNRYVRELHIVHQPLGKSVYQAIGRAASLASAPEIRAPLPWSDPLVAARADLEERLDALNELANHARVFDVRSTHAWRGFGATAITVVEREQIDADLGCVLSGAERLRAFLPAIGTVVADTAKLSIADLFRLNEPLVSVARVDKLPRDWSDGSPEKLQEKAKLFETAGRILADYEQQREVYDRTLAAPVGDARQLLEPAVRDFSHWYQRLSPAYWRWRASVQAHAKPGIKITHAIAVHLHAVVSRIFEIDQWLKGHDAELATDVGPAELRNRGAMARVAEQFGAAAALMTAIQAIKKTPARDCELTQLFRQVARDLKATLPSPRTDFDSALKRVDQRWPSGFVDGLQSQTAEIATLIARSKELLSAMALIQEWTVLQRFLQKCDKLGLTPFIDGLGGVSAKQVREAFELRFYTLWASGRIAQSDALTVFSSGQREELVGKFKKLDTAVQQLVAFHIREFAAEPVRRLRAAQSVIDGSEVGVLRRELQKRKRIKPLRKLFAEIPNALRALKPCMLMSPISVSTYLKPGSASFDLVVFDEASQLPTPEAVASILRAKQVVVAGDRNQLPPTSFFRANFEPAEEDSDGEAETVEEPLESLLDECVAVVPLFREAYLKWHYRSKDERLIKFSNSYFYDNRLVTFPSACSSEDGRGVRLEYVPNGVWDRGRSRTNRTEARRAAEIIVDHFIRYPSRSVGVVAMNAQQKEAIEDAIAEALDQYPEIRPLMDTSMPEPFFVKSLENVQGDERDVMIISVGYGKDPTGHLSLTFGPLNMEGGWRRLNVLVTRAKWQTILITSMHSCELSGLGVSNRGALALRNFIEYAERHCELPQSPSMPTGEETNDFEDAVSAALRDRGLLVDQQVGASKFRIDLAIRDRRDPSRYVLGIECDGATYHSSRIARDRDILRQQVLEAMGWRIHRVWSTEWFHTRDQAIESILSSLAVAESRPVQESVQGIPLPAVPEPDPPADLVAPPGDPHPVQRRFQPGLPYRKINGKADRDLLLQSRYSGQLSEIVVRVVEIEGPIHEDLLSDRLKQLCSVGRAGTNVQSNISEAIHHAIRRNLVERRRQSNFLWKQGAQLSTFRLPANDVRRPLEWIHRDEVALAVLFLIEDQFGVMRSQLGRAVGKLFGLERVPAEAADYIVEVADELVERRQLREDTGRLFLAS